MSERTKIFETVDEEAEIRADAEAEEAIAAGRVVRHADARAWLRDLAAGIRRPPPTPWK